jgi:drug/metabolite transporter (DMT)-like permease
VAARRAGGAEGALVGVAAVWGLTFVMVQDAIRELPTMAFLAYRFTAAALVLCAVFGRRVLALGAAGWRAGALMGVFLTALGFFVQTYAQIHASAVRAALILASEPVFAGVFGYALAGDRLTPLGWVGAGMIMLTIIAVELLPRARAARPLGAG